MLPFIVPFDPANVERDQPWLDEKDKLMIERGEMAMCLFTSAMLGPIHDLAEKVGINMPDPIASRYILTEDMRIVEEPSQMRWMIFGHKAKHRMIHCTLISDGKYRPGKATKRREALPDYRGSCEVSTVFIGYAEDQMFETMVFGGWMNDRQWRTQRLVDAKKLHWGVVHEARLLNHYLKRHWRKAKKLYRRLENFWRLARLRGSSWALKHAKQAQSMMDEWNKMPAQPKMPQPLWIMEWADEKMFSRTPAGV